MLAVCIKIKKQKQKKKTKPTRAVRLNNVPTAVPLCCPCRTILLFCPKSSAAAPVSPVQTTPPTWHLPTGAEVPFEFKPSPCCTWCARESKHVQASNGEHPGKKPGPPAWGQLYQSSLSEKVGEYLLPPFFPFCSLEGLGEKTVVELLHFCSGISSLSNAEEAEAWCLWPAYNEGTLSQCTVQHFGGSPLVRCRVWGRREAPASWCHCISTVIWEPEALLEQTLVNSF